MLNQKSIVFDTDSYKVSMANQYPPGTKRVFSYISTRTGAGNSIFFGLQSFIRDVLLKPVTMSDVVLADKFWTAHGEPFPKEQWMYIVNKHNGKLPVAIYAIEEGTLIPENIPSVVVYNTDPECYWLTTWLETAMLRSVWYPSTVVTQSFEIRKVIKSYLEKSGDIATLPWKLHDFGSRGTSSNESAMLGAMSHLATGAMGTDSAIGIIGAAKFYDADPATVGFSIPAAEHSTVTSWGRDNEALAYENMINQFSKPGSIYAVVSDSYDIYNAVENIWGKQLKDKVISSGGTLVIRPDSGDPIIVLPKLLYSLEEKFGFTKNEKGYKVINNVRLIWGDGITKQTIQSILRTVVDLHGFSADNIAFGMGGKLLQGVGRDDLKFAMKASAIEDSFGVTHEVYKDPITDPGKKSIAGIIDVCYDADGKLQVVKVPNIDCFESIVSNSALNLVFENGVDYTRATFEQVRAKILSNM